MIKVSKRQRHRLKRKRLSLEEVRPYYQGINWMYSYACKMAEDGQDIRKVEYPKILGCADERVRTH